MSELIVIAHLERVQSVRRATSQHGRSGRVKRARLSLVHALLGRGLDQLSPPEVEHVLLELPAERADYLGLVRDIAGWPDRSIIGRRLPGADEVAALQHLAGR